MIRRLRPPGWGIDNADPDRRNFLGPCALSAALAANAADYMMLDLFRIGGVSGWREAAALAFRPGVRLSSHLLRSRACTC